MEFKQLKRDWSSNNQTRYKWLFNKLKVINPDLDEKTYLLTYPKPQLLKFIKELDLGNASKEALYFTASKYLLLNKPKDTSIKKFQLEGYKLKKQTDEEDAENKLDDKEQTAHYNYGYFINILDRTNFNNIDDIKTHYQYLLEKQLRFFLYLVEYR